MNKFYSAKLCDSKKEAGAPRRYRNILANSGEEMESGEIRDIQNLYVMGRDRKLYKISDLATNPDNQNVKYSVNLATNHGHNDPVTGERVVDVEDIIGDARVWLEDGILHARVYFANDDSKADHAYAVSDNASYSIGCEWFDDGYYGAGNSIDGSMGILREISMVDTGNDPSAMTIDTKGKGQGSADGDNKLGNKKGNTMPTTKKSIDSLTPDERAAMQREMGEAVDSIIDKFTTSAPESETEPTARPNDSADGADEPKDKTEDEAEATPTAKSNDKNVLHMPVTIIRDRAVHQEKAVATKDWRFTKEARRKFADMAYRHGGFKGGFINEWQNELKSHGASTNDGITGLGLPVDTRQLIVNALQKSDGIISHFRQLGGKSYLIKLLTAVGADTGAETARAHGFKKGDTKIFQELLNTPRNIYNKMVYKMLDLDTMELYENPELSRIRAEELVQALLVEVERASVISDGRTAPTGNNPDYRMFDGTRGFWSMAADAAATEGFGQLLATAITAPAGSNLYDASILAESAIDAEGGLIYVMKKSVLTTFRQARLNGDEGRYLVEPGMKIEDVINAKRIYTPKWMDYADVDVVVFAENTYGLTGEANPTMRPEFKTETNQDVLLAEQPRGGSLIAYKSAATITFATGATAETQSAKK